jgi:hypothetical protein
MRPRWKKEFSLIHKFDNYSKTKTSAPNYILQKKSLEGIWKHLQQLSRLWKSRKLEWNCAETNFVIQCYETSFFCIPTWFFFFFFFFFFLKTWEPSLMNMEKGSIIFFPNWKEVYWKMESKYVGWLLLSLKRETPAGENKETKGNEVSIKWIFF